MQIKSLERDLGVALFQRHGPRMHLTEDGEALYHMALPMLEGMDHLFESFLEQRSKTKARKINLAANQITVAYLLPAILATFKARYPEIELLIHDLPLNAAIDKLYDEEVDLVMGSFIDVPKTLVYEPYYTFDTVLVTPKQHPLAKKRHVTLHDVAQYDLVRIAPHLITVPLFEEMCSRFHLGSNIKLAAGDWTILKQFVRHGLGVCIISDICMKDEDPDLVARPLNEYFGALTYGTVMKRGKRIPKPVKDLMAVIAECAGRLRYRAT